MPYLTQDIIGTASRMTYGKTGDEVKIYSNHDNVFIVERHDGLRFSVNKRHLSEEKVDRPVEKIKEMIKKKR